MKKVFLLGNAPLLYSTLNTGYDAVVKNVLLPVSPYVGDNVLMNFLLHKPPFSENTIQDVLIANSPLTEKVMDIVNKLGLSATTFNAINNAQIGTSPRIYAERNLAYANSRLTINYNDLISYYLNNYDNENRFADVLSHLDYAIKPDDRAIKVSILLEQEKYSAALAELDSLHSNPKLKAHLHNLIEIKQAANKKQAYTGTIKLAFDSLKAQRPFNIGVKSQALYNSLFDKPFGELIYLDKNQAARLMQQQTELQQKEEQDGLIKIFPNPANNELYVVVNTEEIGSDATINLYDVNGKVALKAVLNNQTTQIDLSQFVSGVYFYQIIANNKLIKSNKVVIIK